MLTLILQKLLHKKWMVLCLLIGNILLISVAVSYPMYKTASFERMLTDEFEDYRQENGVWPAILSVSHTRSIGRDGVSYEELNSYVNQLNDRFGVPIAQEIQYLSTSTKEVHPVVPRDERIEKDFRVSMMTDLEDHIELYAGRMPEPGIVNGEYFEAIASDYLVNPMNVLLDEVYEFEDFTFQNGEPLRVKIVGMFQAASTGSPYWQKEPSDLFRDVFLDEETFAQYFLGEENELSYGMKKEIYVLWDYEKILPGQVKGILQTTEDVVRGNQGGSLVGDNTYEGIIAGYSAKAKKVEASLLILQIPVFALLLAFIYMISSQMLSMEQSEISVMKSRGAGGRQIITLYFIQNLILSLIAVAAGLPLGRVFCSVLGSATDFMEFSATRILDAQYSQEVYLFAAGAVLLTMVITVIPAFRYSKVTIVNLKQSQARKKKSLWKRIFLDLICIGVSLYGYRSFAGNQENMVEQVLTGQALDPLMYLSSSLFLFGFGLFALRLQPLLLKLYFKIRKKRLHPAPYVSLLESIRSGRKQEFIMLFMILTVSLGINNTMVARTIVANAEENLSHITGAELVLREAWTSNAATKGQDDPLVYYEPDFGRYTVIPGVDHVARVQRSSMKIRYGKFNVDVMGIHTREFAQVTSLREGLLPYEYYDYLNVLASSEDAVLASENFMTKQDYRLGDTVVVQGINGEDIRMTIKGFFTYWPSYEPYQYQLGSDGKLETTENYLLVANLPWLQQTDGVMPYEVWMDIGESTDGVYQFVEDNPKLAFAKFRELERLKEDIRSDTLFQGTNGILTMSFIIVLLLCGVGYLIYFIMSIRSRELLFGVLRAMGMRKREVTWMLVLEQVFCGLYSIAAGAVIGLAGSYLFVPMIQNAYAASDQVLPLTLITDRGDLIQLFGIIGIVMLVCLIVIARIVSHMNITKALKLGED